MNDIILCSKNKNHYGLYVDDFSVRNPVTECTTRETLLYISAYTANVKRIRSLMESPSILMIMD